MFHIDMSLVVQSNRNCRHLTGTIHSCTFHHSMARNRSCPEILKKYEIKKKDITNWQKVHIDILNSLDINEKTLSEQEWFELIKLRPELKEKIHH